MIDEATVRLVAALGDASERWASAQRLATDLGADALLILVEDPDVGAMLPAPGFPRTLPGGPEWRALLTAARHPGVHRGRVGYPTAQQLVPVVAHFQSGILLVFIGEACDPTRVEALGTIVPLLACTLLSEHNVQAARGELKAAQEHVRHTENLARALDAARGQVERTVRELEQQTGELQQARGRAEDATLAKDEFLAMLGHELRNPLSPILTALQLLRLKGQASREQDVIERQVDSLIRLVDDLLDVSRITRGKIELRRQRVELAEVAARAVEMSSPLIEKKRQVLAVNIPPRGFVVDVDSSRLAQVLSNLLTNASKYSDTDTRILFSAEQDDAHVRIRVRDQGIGISPELLDHVFDLFVQNRQAIDRSQGGLGLGLAIVRSLIQMHGGTVRVESAGEGRGSEFVVELPRVDSAAGAPAEEPAPEVGALRHNSARLQRVLVVDDNDDARELLAEILESLGYDVRTAPDGPTALRIAEGFKPEIGLLDIGLPIMDGYELAQRLRGNSPHALRLVAVTGYGRDADKQQAKQAGFDAHLVKPIKLEQLEELFQSLTQPT